MDTALQEAWNRICNASTVGYLIKLIIINHTYTVYQLRDTYDHLLMTMNNQTRPRTLVQTHLVFNQFY